MKTFIVILFFVLGICKNVSLSESSAPVGIGAMEALEIPGGKGENVKIIDIEVGYNDKHKDSSVLIVYGAGHQVQLDLVLKSFLTDTKYLER